MNGPIEAGGKKRIHQRIGLFGGTFDPPHIGHLILAAECRYQLRLDRLLWVLTPNPPHKTGQTISPLEQRLDLVRAAIEDNPAFELSRIDIDRPAPQYAVDTVRIVKQNHPEAIVFYLMGGDSLHDLPTWHDPQMFVDEADGLGVMRRPFDRIDLQALQARLPGITEKVHFVEAPLLEISASEIRRRIRSGEPFRYYLPEPVYNLIRERHLYMSVEQA